MAGFIAVLISVSVAGLTVGLLTSIVVTPIFCFLRKLFFVPFIRDKLKKKAIEKGHVVVAHRVERYPGHDASDYEVGVYQFEYRGKVYKIRLKSQYYLETETKLYWLKKPRTARPADYLGYEETSWFKYYLIIALIICMLCSVGGMLYVAR